MPYTGNAKHISRNTRFAWARLNADALFLALLAAGSGLLGFIDPSGPIVDKLGHTTPSYLLVQSAYLIGGLLLMWSLLKEWVVGEVTARTVIMWTVAFQVFRMWSAFGFGDPNTTRSIVVFLIVALTCVLRMTVLLSKRGIVVHLPERHPTLRNGDST